MSSRLNNEILTNVSLFERHSKVKKAGVFCFAIYSLIPEIFKFLCHAN